MRHTRLPILIPLLGCVLSLPSAPAWSQQPTAAGARLAMTSMTLPSPSEVVLTVTTVCSGCNWGRKGQEGAVLRVELDGAYSRHIVVPRSGPYTSRVMLGPVGPGEHKIAVFSDAGTPALLAGKVIVMRVETQAVAQNAPEYAALAHSPIIRPRLGTLERFSDLPMVMWYSTEPSPQGTWIRYSVIFTNEDGGTPPDRLMATWGRLTDIEYVFGIELDASGRVLAEQVQGPDHKFLPFDGEHLGGHPVLHVVTENNMVSGSGGAAERFALVPTQFQFSNVSREVVMDASPWLYRVSSEELAREGRVDPAARPGSGKVPDPRRFVYVEACGETENAAIAFDVGYVTAQGDAIAWAASDGDSPQCRIVLGGQRQRVERPDGCFRAAAALPAGAGDVKALRWRAYTQPPNKEDPPLPRGSGRAHLTRVNRVFQLDDAYVPGPNWLVWTGDLQIPADGPPVEVPRQ